MAAPSHANELTCKLVGAFAVPLILAISCIAIFAAIAHSSPRPNVLLSGRYSRPALTKTSPPRTRTATRTSQPPTRTAMPTRTTRPPTRTATPTRTPWPHDAPAPLAITLEQAERIVLNLAIPEVGRRIERSYITTQAALLAASPDTGITVAGEFTLGLCLLLDHGPEQPDWCMLGALVSGPAILVVEASDAWIPFFVGTHLDVVYGSGVDSMASGGLLDREEPVGTARPTTTRKPLVALFEGLSGELIGFMHQGIVDQEDQRLSFPTIETARLVAATAPTPTPSSTRHSTSHGTPTPLPIPNPRDVPVPWHPWHGPTPLAEGEVPAAIMNTARTLPLVDGAWWRYRTSFLSNGAYWKRSERTIRVQRSERIAPDIVRSELSISPYDAQSVSVFENTSPWWYLFTNGAASRPERRDMPVTTLDDARTFMAWLALEPSRRDLSIESPFQDVVQFPVKVGEQPVYRWEHIDFVDRDVLGTRIKNCAVYHMILSAAITAEHTLCPGVGLVRSETPFLGKWWSGGLMVEELMDYHVPELVEIPR